MISSKESSLSVKSDHTLDMTDSRCSDVEYYECENQFLEGIEKKQQNKIKTKKYKVNEVVLTKMAENLAVPWELPGYAESKITENMIYENQIEFIKSEITLGPIVGLVKQTTARILFEVSHDIALKVSLIPCDLSGIRFSIEHNMTSYRPHTFHFVDLLPNTYYDIKTNLPYLTEVVHSGFRTLRENFSLREGFARIALVSQETLWIPKVNSTNEELSNEKELSFDRSIENQKYYIESYIKVASDIDQWKALSMLATRGEIDYIFHVGGFVSIPFDFLKDLVMTKLSIHEKDFVKKELYYENLIKKCIRSIYHQCWNKPFVRHALANCPNLNICSNDDLGCPWWVSFRNIQHPEFRLILKCALDLYNEYQRPLYDDSERLLKNPFEMSYFNNQDNAFVFAESFGTIGVLCCELFISAVSIQNVYDEAILKRHIKKISGYFYNEDIDTENHCLFSQCNFIFIIIPQPIFRNTTSVYKENEEISELYIFLSSYYEIVKQEILVLANRWKNNMPSTREICFVTSDRCGSIFQTLNGKHLQVAVPPMIRDPKYTQNRGLCFRKNYPIVSKKAEIDVKEKAYVDKFGFLVVSVYGEYEGDEHPIVSWYRKKPLRPKISITLVPPNFEKCKQLPLFENNCLVHC